MFIQRIEHARIVKDVGIEERVKQGLRRSLGDTELRVVLGPSLDVHQGFLWLVSTLSLDIFDD